MFKVERRGRNFRTECTARTCASGVVDTTEVCGIRIHGLPEGQIDNPIVSTARKSRATVLGASPIGQGLLCGAR